MKTEPPCQEPDLEIEHVDNFETDLSTITQKITSLSKSYITARQNKFKLKVVSKAKDSQNLQC